MDQARMLKSLAFGVLLTVLTACSTLRGDFAKPHSEALPPETESPSAQYIDSEKAKQDQSQSGFRLLTLNTNALMSRLALADKAEKSIDLQYFIFANDATGRLVALHLLTAAERGVRVRILLDDIKMKESVEMFDSLDTHPNIEVRLFNPFNTRNPNPVSKATQMVLEFRRLNRRMHNKSYIVDNKVAIVGGRNIADDYFDADEKNNYRDLDLLAIGPVVQEASRAFDAYWNDEASFPVTAYRDTKGDLNKTRAELLKNARAFVKTDYVQAVIEELPDGATADRQGQWFWGTAVLVADQPEKVDAGENSPNLSLGPAVRALFGQAKTELLLMSPYFVPGEREEKDLIAMAHRGVVTRILTNSAGSSDQLAVHAGYSEHRRALLAGGVELYELKPFAGVVQTTAQTRKASSVSLHAKSFVIDRRFVFVGSMNMDERSKLLNTEMGFVVDSPALAAAVAEFFTTATLPANAYRLALEGDKGSGGGSGQILWITSKGDKLVTLTEEPDVGALERVKLIILKMLPIDTLL